MKFDELPEATTSRTLLTTPFELVVSPTFEETLQMAYEQTRRVAPVLAPIVLLCLTLANCGFGCTPAPDVQHDTRASLEKQAAEHCKMSAKIQCPLECDHIDFDAVCDANLGSACDAQCDTSATGTCLDNCNADCATGCEARADTDCKDSCGSRCDDNCETLCAGAPRPSDCKRACNAECGSECADRCDSSSNSSCEGKCGASCKATCSVEAHVACELRCSVDAWTTCKATVRANCMADCSADVMLSCSDPAIGEEPASESETKTPSIVEKPKGTSSVRPASSFDDVPFSKAIPPDVVVR